MLAKARLMQGHICDFARSPGVNAATAGVSAELPDRCDANTGCRGEAKAIPIDHGQTIFIIAQNDRIAQLVVAAASETMRGSGGFGATGVNDAGSWRGAGGKA